MPMVWYMERWEWSFTSPTTVEVLEGPECRRIEGLCLENGSCISTVYLGVRGAVEGKRWWAPIFLVERRV